NIQSSLYLGGILVAIVLFLFLGHFRTAFISLTAIPLSLLTAIILLDRFGVTLNTITLGGLAIAIGEVVDDAIIDVENIFRRLRACAQVVRSLGGSAYCCRSCTCASRRHQAGVFRRGIFARISRRPFCPAGFDRPGHLPAGDASPWPRTCSGAPEEQKHCHGR